MADKLYSTYRTVLTLVADATKASPAAPIPGRTDDYVCAGSEGQPILLLSFVTSGSLKRPPIALQHLLVEFGVRFRVRAPVGIVEGDFIVLSLRSADLELAEAFCLAAEAVVIALPEKPTADEIESTVREFVELLAALSLPPGRAVSGLWAELWLMTLSSDRVIALNAWHAEGTDKFDFSFSSHCVEVKATEKAERIHEFSYEQLRLGTKPIRVVSIKLTRAQGGLSVADLVAVLQIGLGPELRTKLVRNVFGAIGSAAPDGLEVRFDEASAEANLRIVLAERVPAVLIPDGSPISGVRFRVNLDDSSLREFLKKPSSLKQVLKM